jgi:hypothetical protein
VTTDILDTIGLLAFAAGVTGGAWALIGAWALCLGGLVVLAASWFASRGESGACSSSRAVRPVRVTGSALAPTATPRTASPTSRRCG